MPRRNLVYASALGLLALLAAAIVLQSTPYGLGLREDSYTYVTAAESLAAGTGLGRWAADGSFRPLTHFPPLFPYLLAALRLSGLEILPALRILHACLFAATVALTALLARGLTGSNAFSILAAGATVSSRVMMEQFAWAQSEPLYIVLSLSACFLLATFLARPTRGWFVATASAQSLAALTRFAGVSGVLAAVAALALSTTNPSRRIKEGVALFLIGLGPLVVFLAHNLLAFGALIDRPSLTWHPPDASKWQEGASTLAAFVFPHRFLDALDPGLTLATSGIFLLALGAAAGRLLRKPPKPESRPPTAGPLGVVLSCNLIAYSAVVLATVLFVDRLTPLDDRILSPLYLFGLLVFISAAQSLWETGGRVRQVAIAAVMSLLLGLSVYRGVQEARLLHSQGLGLASRAWAESPTLDYIRELPPAYIYTNDIPALYFLAGRQAAFIPSRDNPAQDEPRQDYPSQLADMRLHFLQGPAYLVVVGPNPAGRLSPSAMEEITRGLCLVAQFADGLVFAVSDCLPSSSAVPSHDGVFLASDSGGTCPPRL